MRELWYDEIFPFQFANTDDMHRAGPKYRHVGTDLLIHVKETSMGGHRM